jgi:phospholipid transport system transporter-binding protein
VNDWRIDAAQAGRFAAAGDGWTFAGVLTFEDAATVLEDAARLPLPASGTIDMAGLAHADSAALAVMLALNRRATVEGRRIVFAGMPAVLESLARVYGVEDQFAR